MTDVATAETVPQKPVDEVPAGAGSEDDEDEGKNKGGKSRRELPAGAVATLKAWLLSPEHFTHPYPTPQDQILLMQKTGIDKKQLKNWFTNARRRIWKPMLKKQLEQGKLAQTGAGGGGVVAIPGAGTVPGLMAAPPSGEYVPVSGTVADPNNPNMHVIQHSYQQALQQNQPAQQQATYDSYGTTTFAQQQPQQQDQNQNQQPTHPGSQITNQYNNTNFYAQGTYNQQQANDTLTQNNSIGSLPPMPGATGATPHGSMSNLNKTDSHAVLMELFARDQDLVRQATEGAKQRAAAAVSHNQNSAGSAPDSSNQSQQHQINNNNNGMQQIASQHPMSKMAGSAVGGSVNRLGSVASLNSWPHFSSVSSLNNLTMTGVKSITNMSGADLVSQGSLNKKGNLAQVKSIESMGRTDSFAFLEVFFDNQNGTGSNMGQRGIKREREEDDNVGLSLDGDDPSPSANAPTSATASNLNSSAPTAAPLPADGKDKEGLKRAYDDALAARGLISVSRSSEKLTDLALPAKMQRTLSQEYLKSMNSGGSTAFTSFSYGLGNTTQSSNTPNTVPGTSSSPSYHTSQQYPGQTPQQQYQNSSLNNGPTCVPAPLSDPSSTSSSVEVPATTKCALCGCINVDTQLRPCGHMFHGRCLKPSLQQAMGPPKCPIDHITMQSAVLAVPTDENANGTSTNNSGAYHSLAGSQTIKTESSS